MILSWPRVAAVLAAGVALGMPSAAWADGTATINPGNVPTTAQGATHLCEADFGGGPYPGLDVWVFVLPDLSRDFLSITASFDSDGNGTPDATRTAPADGGIADDNGTSKGWVLAPAGWTLVGATATVTGSNTAGITFNLTHACPASGGTPQPSPTPSTPASPSPSPRPSISITPFGGGDDNGSPSPSTSASRQGPPPPPPPGSPTPSTGGGGGGTPKPSHGPETGGGGLGGGTAYLLGGGSLLAAVVGGAFLLMAYRRRDLA